MLDKNQIKFYKDEGYLLVEDVITQNQQEEMMNIINDLIEKSKNVTKSNEVYDLDNGHSFDEPRLSRIKQPHQVNNFFWDIIANSKIKEILIDLLGKDVSLKTSKLNTKFPKGGTAVEWHQDWVFYPHTNDNVLALGLM